MREQTVRAGRGRTPRGRRPGELVNGEHRREASRAAAGDAEIVVGLHGQGREPYGGLGTVGQNRVVQQIGQSRERVGDPPESGETTTADGRDMFRPGGQGGEQIGQRRKCPACRGGVPLDPGHVGQLGEEQGGAAVAGGQSRAERHERPPVSARGFEPQPVDPCAVPVATADDLVRQATGRGEQTPAIGDGA